MGASFSLEHPDLEGGRASLTKYSLSEYTGCITDRQEGNGRPHVRLVRRPDGVQRLHGAAR
jgi:hypothetical protein